MRVKHYRPDANEREIVAALRKAGATVQVLSSVGNGCADLLVRSGRIVRLLEVKGPHGKLTPAEAEWAEDWAPLVSIVRTPAEALAVCGLEAK